MQYHLDTIPVWDALRMKPECPLCALYQKAEHMEIERTLGGAVMEPDSRIRVNEMGFCPKHHQQLTGLKNKLGHALVTDSHTLEVLGKLEKLEHSLPSGGKRSLFGGREDSRVDKVIRELDAISSSCVVCEGVKTHMERYLYTFLHLWKSDTTFQREFEASKGVCMPHAVELLKAAKEHLPFGKQEELAASVVRLLKTNLEQNEKDLKWFTLKFDYRNQDKPWGDSKDALERTVDRLRGWCLGEEPVEKKK